MIIKGEKLNLKAPYCRDCPTGIHTLMNTLDAGVCEANIGKEASTSESKKEVSMAQRFFFMTAVFFVGLVAILSGQTLAADNFPNRPITLVYGYSAGGVAGNTARAVATGAEKALGQPLVLLCKPGAAGTIAVDFVVDSKPDGYTLLSAHTGTLVYAMYNEGVKFRPKDFTPILGYTIANFAYVCPVNAPWKNYDEWVAYVRSHPGFKYGTYGALGALHVLMEWIAKKENIKLTPVHFKGDAPGITALLGGHIMMHGAAGSHGPQIKAGKLRTLLQVTGIPSDPDPKSVPLLADKYPDCPREFYYLPFGVYGPKGIPEDIYRKLIAAFRAGAQDPSCQQALSTMNMSVELFEPEKLKKEMEKGYVEYGKLIKGLGLER